MDSSFNWLQLRGLGALAALATFVIYAFFVGWWQERSSDRRGPHMTEQDPPAPAKQTLANNLDRRAA